ncbi:MAG TPA: protein kinase [Thermomicrobiales bacterium]|nr:protein kinase [Thermomicrobiales bacterium]
MASGHRPDAGAGGERPGEPVVVADRYELLAEIGTGGTARVYRARDRVLGRVVAIKLLRPEYARDRAAVARFAREARAAAALAHPHIVDVYDYGPHGDTAFIAMHYVDGPDLGTLLRRDGPPPPGRAVAIVAAVLQALGAAHARGIVHRDVTTRNILVPADGGPVKLADFGIARVAGGAEITTAGAAPGTARYMAPEQASGGAVGPAADLYATGVVLYELLAGRPPFEGATPLQVLLRHLHEPPPPLPGVAPALEQVVQTALAKDPADRYPSAAAMLAALRAAWAQAAAPPPAARRDAVTRPLPVRRPAGRAPRAGVLAPALLAVLLLCAGLALAGRWYVAGPGRAATATPPATGVAALPPPTSTRTPPTATAPPAPPATAPAPTSVPTLAPPVVAPAPTATRARPTATRIPATATRPPPPAPTATTPPTGPAATLRFGAGDLAGAYRRTDGTLYGRPAAALYGAGSGYDTATVAFEVRGGTPGAAVLVLTGLDDERAAHTDLAVLVNGVPVYAGQSAFPNVPPTDNGVGGGDRYWGEMRIALPAGVLRPGRNTLTLRDTTPWQGALGIPYILIDAIVLGP